MNEEERVNLVTSDEVDTSAYNENICVDVTKIDVCERTIDRDAKVDDTDSSIDKESIEVSDKNVNNSSLEENNSVCEVIDEVAESLKTNELIGNGDVSNESGNQDPGQVCVSDANDDCTESTQNSEVCLLLPQ